MKWPWQNKPETDLPAAKQAVDSARIDWARVRAVSERAERQKRNNGFGELLVRAMGGKP